MAIKFDAKGFEKQFVKTVEEGFSKKLSEQLPGELLDRLVKSGAVIKIDDAGHATLSGGDPAINDEAMAIWKSKSE